MSRVRLVVLLALVAWSIGCRDVPPPVTTNPHWGDASTYDAVNNTGVMQPPLPPRGWSPGECEAASSTDPWRSSAWRWEVRHGMADATFAWNLAEDGTLWLSHPALEGRATLDLPRPAEADILVTRAENRAPRLLATAAGVSPEPHGLVADRAGALVVARVLGDARVNGRALGVAAGSVLLRFDRVGTLLWVAPLGEVRSTYALRARDGSARLLLDTTGTFSLRGVRIGTTSASRLTLVRFGASGDPADASELDAATSSLGDALVDDAIVDDDGGIRVRVGLLLLALDDRGVLRWQATLPTASHTLRRDGSTWSASGRCDAVRPAGVPQSAHEIACVSVLAPDGRTRASQAFYALASSADSYEEGTATLEEDEASGLLVLEYAGTRCRPKDFRCLAPPLCVRVGETIPLSPSSFGGRALPWLGPSCVGVTYGADVTPWRGGVRCRRACAQTGSCAGSPSLDATTACGAPGRDCNGDAAAFHAVGRCVDHLCAVGACQTGWADCNGVASDGCEAELARSSAHCGACGRACAGTCNDGRCCVGDRCTTAFEGDGREGDFAPESDVTLSSGVHQFARIEVPQGVTVRVDGDGTLDLRATGPVVIQGTIDLSGGNGLSGGAGGATGRRVAGGGPSNSGAGPGGGASAQPYGRNEEARGAAPGETGLGNYDGRACLSTTGEMICQGTARGGVAGAPGYDGRSARTTASSCNGIRTNTYCTFRSYSCDYSAGSGSIGPRALRDMAVSTTFEAGSGGGATLCAGPAYRSSCGPSCGGGGGGGALRLASAVSITLGAAAAIRADGGESRDPFVYAETSWSGEVQGAGAGSGGVVYLAAPALDVAPGALVSAVGGFRGLGRIRVSVDPARCHVAGAFLPPITPDCRPTPPDVRCQTYVNTWPL